MKKISEKGQVKKFVKWLKETKTKYKCEVPVLLKLADLVIYDGHSLTAIEFKLEDWRKAIIQVSAYSASFDKLAICVMRPATKKTMDDIIEECTSKGIGLYFTYFDEGGNFSCEQILFPKPVKHVWRFQRDSIIKQIGWKNEVCINT